VGAPDVLDFAVQLHLGVGARPLSVANYVRRWLCKLCPIKRERDAYKRAMEMLIESRISRAEKMLDETERMVKKARGELRKLLDSDDAK
jgi:hypothetical protein